MTGRKRVLIVCLRQKPGHHGGVVEELCSITPLKSTTNALSLAS
jgi:hypothetical protein